MSAETRCNECGRETPKAHRTHKGHRYCATCYARVFKRRMCPKCGHFARLPKYDLTAVCRKCETFKPCARCGKIEYEIGKITPYGPVCHACAPHFREPEPCEACGEASPRLSRVRRLGHDLRLCPKCARAGYGTCAACRRHRLLIEAPDGRMLCTTCLDEGEVPCPSCSKPMPAGRGKVCEACYWTETCRKRIRMDSAAFSVGEMESAFGSFGEWLIGEIGPNKAALRINRYLPFFLEMERRWNRIPSYGELLGHFGAEGLRRVRLPMRWLREARAVVPDPEAREEDSERRRIETVLESIPSGTPANRILVAYKERLIARIEAGKSSLRSVRLALRPAASLLLMAAAPDGGRLPNQTALDHYLLDAPGQKAAITGFVNFLNETYRLDLIPKADAKLIAQSRRKKLEKELMTLMREGGEGEEFLRRWLSAALAYFHGLPRKTGKNIRDEQIIAYEDGSFSVSLSKQNYWLPKIGILKVQTI